MVTVFQNVNYFSVNMEGKMRFLSIIINERATGANGWGIIAKKMNSYLFEMKA